jgi:hypothetical protein
MLAALFIDISVKHDLDGAKSRRHRQLGVML